MTCTNCSTPNIDSAIYCKNCGSNLMMSNSVVNTTPEEDTDKVVNLFIMIISAGLFVGLFYFIINTFSFTNVYSYKFVTIITNLITPIVTLIAAVQMPNQKAKTFLFIAFALELVFFIGYRLMQYF